MYRDPLAGHIV